MHHELRRGSISAINIIVRRWCKLPIVLRINYVLWAFNEIKTASSFDGANDFVTALADYRLSRNPFSESEEHYERTDEQQQ